MLREILNQKKEERQEMKKKERKAVKIGIRG